MSVVESPNVKLPLISASPSTNKLPLAVICPTSEPLTNIAPPTDNLLPSVGNISWLI